MSWFIIQSLLTILAAFAVGVIVGRLSHIRRRPGKPAPIPEATPQTDDELERIEGIGPALANALRAAGLRTFAQLADSDDAAKRAAIQTAGFSFAPSLPTWGPQARLLADGDEIAFRELTERLIAGRPEKAAAALQTAPAQASTALAAGRPGRSAARQNTARGRKTTKSDSLAGQDAKADAIHEAKATVDGTAVPAATWRDLGAPDVKLTLGGGTNPETGRATPRANDGGKTPGNTPAADHRLTAEGTPTAGTAPRANDDTGTSAGGDRGDADPAPGRDTTTTRGSTSTSGDGTTKTSGGTPATSDRTAETDSDRSATSDDTTKTSEGTSATNDRTTETGSGKTLAARDGTASRPGPAGDADHRPAAGATRTEDRAAPGATTGAIGVQAAVETADSGQAADARTTPDTTGGRTDVGAAQGRPDANGTRQGTNAESAR